MGENIIERVARALAEANGFDWQNCAQDQWRADVRTVLAALREPSEAMIEAGEMCDAADVWRSMIDAILNEGNE